MRKRYRFTEELKFRTYIFSFIFIKNIYLRYISNNTLIPHSYRQLALLFLWSLNKNISFSKLNAVCLETGKIRGTLINFKVSRLVVKKLVLQSVLNGVYKYSW
jgi:ribosomal protein S14